MISKHKIGIKCESAVIGALGNRKCVPASVCAEGKWLMWANLVRWVKY